jgi:hypothetical protein
LEKLALSHVVMDPQKWGPKACSHRKKCNISKSSGKV